MDILWKQIKLRTIKMSWRNKLDIFEDKMKNFYSFIEKQFYFTVIILFFMTLGIRLFLTPYHQVLREDAYIYVMKGIEISRGNFTPSLTHAIGLSFFLAPFFKLFGSDSIFQNMLYARIISVIVGSLSIFPLALICKKLLGRTKALLVLIFFCFSNELIISAYSVYTEPLFMLLLLLTVLFILKSTENRNWILASSLCGAISFSVRTNGLFFLPIILLSIFLIRKQIPSFSYFYFIYTVLIFTALISPFAYQRYVCFGSPFYYGENSKIFVDDSDKVWSSNIPIPSYKDYISQHTFADFIEKFIVRGFLKSLTGFLNVISPFIIPFTIYGIFAFFKDKHFVPLLVLLILWHISLTPGYAVFSSSRYFIPVLPIALIFGTAAMYKISEKISYANTLLSGLICLFIIFSLFRPVRLWRLYQIGDEKYEWAKWAAENLRGKLAIIEGGDLVMMHLSDTVVGGVGMMDIYAPQSGLSIVRPGYFDDLKPAMDWLRQIGATHIALDEINIERRPYLRQLLTDSGAQPYLKRVYSNYEELTQWKIRIYKIVWDKYDNIP